MDIHESLLSIGLLIVLAKLLEGVLGTSWTVLEATRSSRYRSRPLPKTGCCRNSTTTWLLTRAAWPE